MAFTIEYDQLNARYLVYGLSDTVLIIRPYKKDKSWIAVEYTDDGDAYLEDVDKEDFDIDKCQTKNDVINEVDAAILFKTKDLPSMLRELANFIETGRRKKLIKYDL